MLGVRLPCANLSTVYLPFDMGNISEIEGHYSCGPQDSTPVGDHAMAPLAVTVLY